MEIECCCCEQPISNQKIIYTAISLDTHNNNIRFPSKNSASGHHQFVVICFREQQAKIHTGSLQYLMQAFSTCESSAAVE